MAALILAKVSKCVFIFSFAMTHQTVSHASFMNWIVSIRIAEEQWWKMGEYMNLIGKQWWRMLAYRTTAPFAGVVDALENLYIYMHGQLPLGEPDLFTSGTRILPFDYLYTDQCIQYWDAKAQHLRNGLLNRPKELTEADK